jgi:hypothetical protein
MAKSNVTVITSVRDHGETLTIVTVDDHEVVANKLEDGTPRWKVGEVCVYVPENSILPEDVLKARGYWNDEKNKGLLGGSKGNRVKMQRFAGHESRGLLFKVGQSSDINPGLWFERGDEVWEDIGIGSDVTEFLGITEYIPEN